MPKLTRSLPRIRKHKASNRAYINLENRPIYLGPYGSKIAQKEYDRVVCEWLANDRKLPIQDDEIVTMADLILRYIRFAKRYYVKLRTVTDAKTGKRSKVKKQTDEVVAVKGMCRVVRDMYGTLPVGEFTPTKLEAVREKMIQRDWSRKHINKQISRVIRMMKWGVGKELVPGHIPEALRELAGLKKGRSKARETARVKPIDDETVDATLAELGTIVRDMAQFQRFTGARPFEVCQLRPCDIDRTEDVWIYRSDDKNDHHNDDDREELARVVPIGPKAQAILVKYLLRAAEDYCFDPREAPGARKNSKDRYTKDSYGRAVRRAVRRINERRIDEHESELLELWSPNRLRHSRATEIKREHGVEASRVTLGHSKIDMTELYAERDLTLAKEVARISG